MIMWLILFVLLYMKNNTPLLSICIPTYNRSRYLQVSLAALIEQSESFHSDIEIVVSDNASTDNTEESMNTFRTQFSNLKYVRNTENLWYDRNLDNAIKNANGKYCWFLSDDELVLPWTIEYVLHLLKQYNDISYICLEVAWNNPKKIENTEITYVENGNTLLSVHGLVGGLISQNIIRRDLYPSDVSKFYGNHWIHLSVIFEIIRNKPLLLINKSLLKGQRDICTWAEWWKAFITFSSLKNIIESWKEIGYEESIINNLMWDCIKDLPKIVFSAKIHGLQKTPENIAILRNSFSQYGMYYYGSWIIFMMPPALFLLLRKILWR